VSSALQQARFLPEVSSRCPPQCGIVGLPDVGIVEPPDPRPPTLAGIVKPGHVVPPIVELVDIAGLVAGASRCAAST